MDTFTLSRDFRNFCFDNPEKINPWHWAIFFFAIEHCNRLGWKEKFWFPSQMVMEAVWIRNWRTYQKYLNDLVDWGFIILIEKSKNQYSSNIIAIVKNTKAPTKALDKALQKHHTKQSQSTASIDIQDNKEPIKQDNYKKDFIEFIEKENNISSKIMKVFLEVWYKPVEKVDDFRKWTKEKLVDTKLITNVEKFDLELYKFELYYKANKSKNLKLSLMNWLEKNNNQK